MSRLANQHATLVGRMRDAGTAPAIRFAEDVASLHRGYIQQRETNSRLWHDNRALRNLLRRAHDAMSRREPDGISTADWDQLVADMAKEIGNG